MDRSKSCRGRIEVVGDRRGSRSNQLRGSGKSLDDVLK